MRQSKYAEDYEYFEEISTYYKERMNAYDSWDRGEKYQKLVEEYQQAIMDYNETTNFHEYVPKLSTFDKLVIKGMMTDRY